MNFVLVVPAQIFLAVLGRSQIIRYQGAARPCVNSDTVIIWSIGWYEEVYFHIGSSNKIYSVEATVGFRRTRCSKWISD